MSENYRFPGDFVLENLELIDKSGTPTNILPLSLELNVLQNIFQPFMKLEIAVNDSAGFVNAVPRGLSGGETVYVAFKTRDPEFETMKMLFAVNGVKHRERTTTGNEKYIIEAFSLEHFNVIDKKISKAFGIGSGKKINEIVEIIFDEFIMTPEIKSIYQLYEKEGREVTKKGLETAHTTTGLHKCVIPRYNPIEAISYLSSEAVDDDVASKLLFYENFLGYQFRSLGKLVKEEPKGEEYHYHPSSYNTDSYKKGMNAYFIKKLERIKESDLTEQMSDGLFAATTIELDPLRKDFTKTIYKYQDEVERFSKLNKFTIPGGADDNAIVHLKTSRRGHDVDPVFSEENPLAQRDVLKDPIRDSYLKHLTNQVIRITVPGNSQLNVGDVIDCKFTPATSFQEGKEEDKYTSGKYLITKCRHSITKEMYDTHLECVKDTGTEE
jgi:hypothetical protein